MAGRAGVIGWTGLAVLLLAAVVSAVVAGVVSANWEGGERESREADCASLRQSCGGFCVYPKCTLCNDCSCVCCSAAKDPNGEGCYCTAPCPCWLNDEGEKECEPPVTFTFEDCGDTCIEWEWLLYQGSNQPGRGDGVVDNPFFTDGLGTAMFVVKTPPPFRGTECYEEEVAATQTPAPVNWGLTPSETVVIGFEADEVMATPEGGFREECYTPESGAVALHSVTAREVEGVVEVGRFDVVVSGVPGGRQGLLRQWEAGTGLVPTFSEEDTCPGMPRSGVVPFEAWSGSGVLELPRGWRAVQVAYLDAEGEPAGHSRVVVVWSGVDPEGPLPTVREPSSPTVTPLPTLEGVERPPAPTLGEGDEQTEPGRVLFQVSAVPASAVMQYRAWEATGRAPDEGQAEWKTAVLSGSVLSLAREGVETAGGGFMAVQVRLVKTVADHGEVAGPGSVVRYYWVMPDAGSWDENEEVPGEYLWREPVEALFRQPVMTPAPPPVPELGPKPGTPSLGAIRRLRASWEQVMVDVSGLAGGDVELEYRLWQSTGRPPVGEEGEWERIVPVNGELVLRVAEEKRGGRGQWMSLHVRQVREMTVEEKTAVVAGEPSGTLHFRAPPQLPPLPESPDGAEPPVVAGPQLPAGGNLRGVASAGQAGFAWDAPEWPGGRAVSYDYELTLPDGRRESARLTGATGLVRWGSYPPGGHASVSVKVNYEASDGQRRSGAEAMATCNVP